MLASVENVTERSFDYIIVGGGTAGLVVASRLSEDPSVSVLVLEAGRANLDDESITMSGTFGKNFFHPENDWAFMTASPPLTEFAGLELNFYAGSPKAHGKGLGGTSGMNFYVFTQPPAEDINAIERLGNPGWNWDRYIHYSRKSETFIPPDESVAKTERLEYDAENHGTDGPITTCYAPMTSGWEGLYQDASQISLLRSLGNLGLKPVKDATKGDGNGSWMATCSVDPHTNRRAYAVSYLNQARGRRNLSVVVRAPVSRILSAPEKSADGKLVASGVEFTHDGKSYRVLANREVILSAGAIKSPQILELSGIGNKDLLSKLGIPTKIDLPSVGENVQEHIFAAASFELKDPEKYNTLDPIADPEVLKEQLKLYAEHKGLFLLSFLGIGTASLDRLSPNGAALSAAHIDKVKAQGALRSPGLQAQYELQIEKLEKGIASMELVSMPTFLSRPNPPEAGKKYITIVSIMNHPWSRGTIHAASADPQSPPTVDPHYFEDEFDLQNMVELVKFMRKLGKTAPLGDIIAREHNPGAEVETDEQLVSWVKKTANSIAHTSGTCSMLPQDKGGVVDPRLKVYGTANVRVVDLSILPLHIGAPTQSACVPLSSAIKISEAMLTCNCGERAAYVYGMAEQAADIIKGVI
ncbi:GMC oxidoreductase [Artomyces pyxidatus]|uniref:GMC oxidoreductase n=1 Tax=Artomyces pyxidatus TaxID=48021 RepID=A0ACB8TLA0_9AGAM|nr:GMC oxidoreductase [Artomyces pyxidatus]